MKSILCMMAACCFTMTVLADEVKVELKDLPRAVLDTVKKRFPRGMLSEATKVTDDGDVEYELTIEVGETTHFATVLPNGRLTHTGKEITVKDLPRTVAGAITKAYPKMTVTYAGEIAEVVNNKEVFAYYEVELTVDDKTVDLEVSPDGKTVKVVKQLKGK